MKHIIFLTVFGIYHLGAMQLNGDAIEKMHHKIACIKAGIISKEKSCQENPEYQKHLAQVRKSLVHVDGRGIYYIVYERQMWSLYVPKMTSMVGTPRDN